MLLHLKSYLPDKTVVIHSQTSLIFNCALSAMVYYRKDAFKQTTACAVLFIAQFVIGLCIKQVVYKTDVRGCVTSCDCKILNHGETVLVS